MEFATRAPLTFRRAGAGLARYGNLVIEKLAAIAEHDPRLRRVTYLQSLSDAELARKGLTRDRIVPHVFGASMWV